MKFIRRLREKMSSMTDTNLLLTITIVVFVAMYLSAMIFIGGSFLRAQELFTMLNHNAHLIILSCGLSLVMITGGIDISVGGVTALVAMCSAVYIEEKGGNIWGAILISVAIGLAFGLVQGYLVAYLDIQPFIVTLAGMFFARGMTTIVRSNQFNVTDKAFLALKDTHIIIPYLGYWTKPRKGEPIYVDAYITIGVIVALLVVVAMFCMLRWMKLGRNFYAVGGNSQSALMLGINVKRTKFLSHVICGLLAGIGGLVYFMKVGSGAPAHASGEEMNAIASSIIGGTLLTGGVGNIIGTFFGVLSLSTIKDIVTSLGLQDAWWTGITTGAMLCMFLVIQSIVLARKSNKAGKEAVAENAALVAQAVQAEVKEPGSK